MSWWERVRETLDFVSPQNKKFSAFWKGDAQAKEKSLGIFKYPGVKGAVVQDMNVGGTSYPLNFFFSGENNDKEGAAFFQACDEEGLWTITHPVDGVKKLQLVKIQRSVDPTNLGNITVFASQWLETIDKGVIISISQAEENLRSQAALVDEAAKYDFEENISLDNASLRNSVVLGSRSLLDKISNAMSSLYALNAQINSYVNTVQRSVNDALNQIELNTSGLAVQFQELIQLPMHTTDSVSDRLNALRILSDSIFDLSPDTPWGESRNIVGIMDLGVTASLTAAAQSVIGADLKTRREAIEIADLLSVMFDDVINDLDALQKVFDGQRTSRRYFSQGKTFGDLSFLMSQAVSLTIQASFDLSVEKRIVLDRPRAPIEIALTEYGDLGPNDEKLDFFIETNNLTDVVTLLPPGKEIVLYV